MKTLIYSNIDTYEWLCGHQDVDTIYVFDAPNSKIAELWKYNSDLSIHISAGNFQLVRFTSPVTYIYEYQEAAKEITS